MIENKLLEPYNRRRSNSNSTNSGVSNCDVTNKLKVCVIEIGSGHGILVSYRSINTYY